MRVKDVKIIPVAEETEAFDAFIRDTFAVHAESHGIRGRYEPFAYEAKAGDETAGVVTGHTLYHEAHVSELIVAESFRGQGVGTALLNAAERDLKARGARYVTVSTHRFQAPGFYEKRGYRLEYVREDKDDPALSKYYFVKDLTEKE